MQPRSDIERILKLSPVMPVIVIEDMQQDSFRIDAGYPGGFPPSPDPCDDPRIASVLASAGKLVP